MESGEIQGEIKDEKTAFMFPNNAAYAIDEILGVFHSEGIHSLLTNVVISSHKLILYEYLPYVTLLSFDSLLKRNL